MPRSLIQSCQNSINLEYVVPFFSSVAGSADTTSAIKLFAKITLSKMAQTDRDKEREREREREREKERRKRARLVRERERQSWPH